MKKYFFLEYNFFKYEDKSDKNIYPLKKLKSKTKKMEKTNTFKKLIKKIENVIIIVIMILISLFFIVMKKTRTNDVCMEKTNVGKTTSKRKTAKE